MTDQELAPQYKKVYESNPSLVMRLDEITIGPSEALLRFESAPGTFNAGSCQVLTVKCERGQAERLKPGLDYRLAVVPL